MQFVRLRFAWVAALLLAALLCRARPSVAQINGIWTDTISNNLWSDSTRWLNGVSASGSGATADFSMVTLPAADTVVLNVARTVGSLIYGDQGNTYGWTLASAGRMLTLAASSTPTITVDNESATISLVLLGTQGFAKYGPGSLVLTTPTATALVGTGGYDTFSGPIAADGGLLSLDFHNATGTAAPQNLLNTATTLSLGGGTLSMIGIAGGTASQSFASTSVTSGASTVTVSNAGASLTTLTLGPIVRSTGGAVNFSLPAGGQIATTTGNTNSILGAWATIGNADWATKNAAGFLSSLSSYTNDAWLTGNNTNVTTNDSPTHGSTTNSLRFNAAAANTITLASNSSSDPNIIASGGILVTANVGGNASAINGGFLTSGSGQDLIVQQYNAAGALTISSTIANNGATAIGLTKSGNGALILSGNNSYTGGTYVNAGVLSLQNNNALGGSAAGPLTIASGAELDLQAGLTVPAFSGANFATIAGTGVSNNGAINVAGSGATACNSAVTLAGPTTVTVASTSGSLTLGGAINTTVAGNQLTFSGAGSVVANNSINLGAAATINAPAGGLTLAGPINNGANLLTFGGSGDISIGNVIGGGAGGMTFNGTGTLTFNGAAPHTYTGPTTVNAGTLALNFSNLSTPNNLINAASSLTFGGGTLSIKANPGVATAQTFAGTTINAGPATLNLDPNGGPGITLNLGNLTRNLAGTMDVPSTANATVTTAKSNTNSILGGWATYGGGTDWAVNGAGSGTAPITGLSMAAGYQADDFSAATNNVDVTGSDAPASPFTVNSLRFSQPGAAVGMSGSASSTIVSGGILVTPNVGSGGASLDNKNNPLLVSSGDLVIQQFDASGVFTISALLAGAYSLTKAGPGTLLVGNSSSAPSNAYTGGTYVNAGTLQVGMGTYLSSLPNTTAVTVASGATLELLSTGGNGQLIAGLNGAGTVLLDGNQIYINGGGSFSGSIQDGNFDDINSTGGHLIKYGAGTLALLGSSSYSGGTLIGFAPSSTLFYPGGTLEIGSDAALGAVPAAPASNIYFIISGTLQFAGSFALSSNRGIVINSPTIAGSPDGTGGSGGGGLFVTATLDVNGNNVSYGGTISSNASASGAGALAVSSSARAGSLTLSGANTYNGGTTINQRAMLIVTNAGAIGGASEGAITVASGGELDLQNGIALPAPAAAKVLTIAGAGTDAGFGGALSNGSGNNSYAGPITLAGPASIASASGTLTLSSSTATSINNASNLLTFTGAGNIAIGGSDTITGAGGLLRAGSGLLSLGTANSYSGGTIIVGGTVSISSDLSLGSVPASPAPNIFFTGNGTLQFAPGYSGGTLATNRGITVNPANAASIDTVGNNLIAYGGALSLSNFASFAKTGAGTFEIDKGPTLGANSALQVQGGTLRFDLSAGSTTIGGGVSATVAPGATLELSGSVSALNQTVNITNDSQAATTGGLSVTGTNQKVGTITGAGNIGVNSGASLIAYQIRQNSLAINGTGAVTLSPSGSGSTSAPGAANNVNFSSRVNSLSIGGTTDNWTGKLDIGNNGLVIQYGTGSDPYATIVNLIKSAYGTGNWNGNGITSSLAAAAANSAAPLNIGLVDFVPNGPGFGSSIVFAGQTISTSAVLVRLTYMDDLVLAGDMAQGDATSDALRFAANYGTGTTWSVGDLNHDGVINTNDALLFAANYVVGLPSLDGTTGNAAALGRNAAAVPEPASFILAWLGAIGLFFAARRRGTSRASQG